MCHPVRTAEGGRAEGVVGLLAEPERLRVFAALVLGARSAAEAGRAADLDQRAVGRALQRLEAGGLVERVGQQYRPVIEAFKQIARVSAPPAKAEEHGYADQRVETVVRTFIKDGRLTALPAQAGRRQMIFEHIVRSFEPGRNYAEAEVNTILRAWTEGGAIDHVTLRRYLVDAGLLSRRGNAYWRTGGWVDVLDRPDQQPE
jgi:hypothetical protein